MTSALDYGVGGMTLRDYFAAHALQGLIASGDLSDQSTIATTEAAYRYASAMLLARSQ